MIIRLNHVDQKNAQRHYQRNAGHNGVNGESVVSHVTVNAPVLAPVPVDLRAVRSALETILNLNHATNHNAAWVTGIYGVIAL